MHPAWVDAYLRIEEAARLVACEHVRHLRHDGRYHLHGRLSELGVGPQQIGQALRFPTAKTGIVS